MANILLNILKPRIPEEIDVKKNKEIVTDGNFEKLGNKLKKEIGVIFGRSLAIRHLDTGSDNSTEIELVNLTTPHYDIERFGICFVASPRHADIIIITGAVTPNMAIAAKKTYEAMPDPKFVIAVGDDACGLGLFNESYAVLGGADKILPIDLKIPGNPPKPIEIMQGLLELMEMIKTQKKP